MSKVGPETYVRVDHNRVHEVVQTIVQAREQRSHLFADSKVSPPEEKTIPMFIEYGKYRNLPDFALNAVVFVTNNLYADSTTRQLRRISSPQRLEEFEWLFDPNQVSARNQDEVFYRVIDFLRPARYHGKRTAYNWRHNANVLARNFQGSVRKFFEVFDNDAEKIQPVLQGPTRKKDWELFMGFGPKISRLTLQYIGQYNLAPLKKLDNIGVPVDFLIARILIGTEAIRLVGNQAHKKWVLDKTAVPLLTQLCIEHGISPQRVSEALWLLGHFGCNQLRHDQCQLQTFVKL